MPASDASGAATAPDDHRLIAANMLSIGAAGREIADTCTRHPEFGEPVARALIDFTAAYLGLTVALINVRPPRKDTTT